MFKKILVPLDGSPLAAKVLPLVTDLAKTHGAQVTLLHVYYTGLGEGSPAVIQEAVAQEAKRCELFLAQTAKDLEAQGLKVEVACVEGSPAREIIGYAKQQGVDLICMATHGKGEVAWVLGSVAEKVVSHSPVPVLLVRVMEISPLLLKEDPYFTRGLP
jgi:nucleotide-binding universal stress UspA family protein